MNSLKNLTPNKLFLLDGSGAIVSAISLGIILPQFEEFFGMPARELYLLAAVALVFACYSMVCHFKKVENWKPLLLFIAISNFIYCLVTIGCMVFFNEQLTTWGYGYFILEIIIVLSIVAVEVKKVFSAA